MLKAIVRYIRRRIIENTVRSSDLFDSEWYQQKYSVPAEEAYKHYSNIGYKQGYDPSERFSTSLYLRNNTDVARNGVNPLFHYERYGRAEKRSIYPSYFTMDENTLIPDYIYSDYSPVNVPDIEVIRRSGYFSPVWYALHHLFSFAIVNPAAHYLKYGASRLYDPSPFFSSAGFLFLNPILAGSILNPLLYFEQNRNEALRIMDTKRASEQIRVIKRSRYFNPIWYRQTYRINGSDSFTAKHYFAIGIAQKLDPGPLFSTLGYCLFNGFSGNPLQHLESHPNSSLISSPNNPLNRSMMIDRDALDEVRGIADPGLRASKQSTPSVDIIICVHNALADVKLCISSVLSKTHHPFHILIVNDNSNPETTEYLQSVSGSNSNVVTYISNDTDNHGYTYSANIGLRASNADYCVLLNSDTIVTEAWITKMLACFASDPAIGIVGPLSNTASWQSVPKLTDDDGDWAHNTLPEGFDVDRMGKVIESNSKKLYPSVPLLNGFCLMISRKTIDTIGYFDEESFGKGFAEEDDYNLRAGKAGVKLAIADDTYIFHAQSKSYTDETRRQLCDISGRKLREKHGEDLINRHCYLMQFSHVMQSFRERTAINIERDILYHTPFTVDRKLTCGFLLPTATAGGGSNIILNEASFLSVWGIESCIINLKAHKTSFEQAYPNLDIPVVYLDSFDSLNKIASNYDFLICTLYSTVKYCSQLDAENRPRILYYIQDFEPFFFDKKDRNFSEALKSYSLIKESILVTKTTWNQKMIKDWTGRDSFLLGPSVNVDQFYPRTHFHDATCIRITAMIRPSSERRSPEFTYMVLREIKKKYGDLVHVQIFGNNPEVDGKDFAFYLSVPQDIVYTNYGLLNPQETSALLSETDIFVDLSTYQAMGLTGMEAMCSGCATILPIYGGTTDFAVDRNNALLVDTQSFDACFNAVCHLIDDRNLREHLSRNAAKSILQYYPEKAAKNLADILKEYVSFSK